MSIVVEERQADHTVWFNVEGKDCDITIEKRPYYCDRGNWIAKLHPRGGAFRHGVDGQEGWPRYYFDWDRMLAEIEAWLQKREQMPEPSVKVLK